MNPPASRGLGRLLLACALASGLVTLLSACSEDEDPPLVMTQSGALTGTRGAAADLYLGIPYAAPPVGERRWRAPAAVTPWTGERAAVAMGPHCAQPPSDFGVASTSEDCLYLNVYAPRTAGPHPVMVWIHGGAFYLGQGNAYNPEALVAQGTVVVTLNYRLGALGFLANPALSAEQAGHSGNYGLMDQQAALRWVKANIAAFGGDPGNVTLFGESAGGFSVNAHLAAPASRGLFHKAIAMSGAYPFAFGQDDLAASEARGTGLAADAGCPAPQTAACLRALPVQALLTAQAKAWPSGPIPTVDGAVLTAPVRDTFASGGQASVPVMQGTTHDEWRLFVAQAELATGMPVTAETYLPTVTATLGPLVASAAPLYPVAAYANASEALGAIGTDAVFACSGRASARLLSAGGSVVYSYEFNDPAAPQVLPGQLSFKAGAAHTSELPYLFTLPGSAELSPAQRRLADTMVRYWARFARSGNPNEAGATTWPAYTAANDAYLSLAPSPAVTTNFATDHQCAVWTPGM